MAAYGRAAGEEARREAQEDFITVAKPSNVALFAEQAAVEILLQLNRGPEQSARPENDRSERYSGTIKLFDRPRGYGYIEPDDGGPDVYFRLSAISDLGGYADLEEGFRVQYDLKGSPKETRRALHVQRNRDATDPGATS
ncbi:MAG TPA: cold shock domain-containing protein [Microbacteriaceae bacterium]|nr:cold shock domain-containing protein [Microbacteriaceae bacterium]